MDRIPPHRCRALARVVALAAFSIGGSTAQSARAEMTTAPNAPVVTSRTPGMIGGSTIGAGRLVLGAAGGYAETQLRAMFGLGRRFDLGVFAGITYGQNDRLSGIRQDLGMDLQVPLRWEMLRWEHAAMALRLVPYFRTGEFGPAIGAGGTIGSRVSLNLHPYFALIVGAEARLGYGHYAFNVPGGRAGQSFFDGAFYGILGGETFVKEKWILNAELDLGGTNAVGRVEGGFFVNAFVGIGYMLH